MLLRAIIVVVLLLWSTRIGDEVPPPLPEPIGDEAAVAAAPVPDSGEGGARVRKPSLATRREAQVDTQAFIAAFRRQSERELVPCLRTWQLPPDALGVMAVLTRRGTLDHFASLDPLRPLPKCAEEAVKAMEFKALAATLGSETVTLHWRIDW